MVTGLLEFKIQRKSTNSEWGKTILESFENYINKFLTLTDGILEELFNKSSVAA